MTTSLAWVGVCKLSQFIPINCFVPWQWLIGICLGWIMVWSNLIEPYCDFFIGVILSTCPIDSATVDKARVRKWALIVTKMTSCLSPSSHPFHLLLSPSPFMFIYESAPLIGRLVDWPHANDRLLEWVQMGRKEGEGEGEGRGNAYQIGKTWVTSTIEKSV